MIIWIPRGDDSDSSRDTKEMDLVARCFEDSGVTEIKDDGQFLSLVVNSAESSRTDTSTIQAQCLDKSYGFRRISP